MFQVLKTQARRPPRSAKEWPMFATRTLGGFDLSSGAARLLDDKVRVLKDGLIVRIEDGTNAPSAEQRSLYRPNRKGRSGRVGALGIGRRMPADRVPCSAIWRLEDGAIVPENTPGAILGIEFDILPETPDAE